MGYKIQYYPPAVTWEQEPQTLSVWMKQRTRWAAGNFYVLIKNLRLIFTPHNVVKFDVLYFFAVYFLFLSSIILSDICCIGGAFGMIHLTLQGSSVLVWVMAYAIFVLSVATALLTEKGEADPSNLLLILIMYFTYCQLWMLVSIGGFFAYLRNAVLHRQMRWYKTERF
jgi:cellulose synthase/poly-beta-1,6-N-acetylglucosamine synthase-like glycosyltransferase